MARMVTGAICQLYDANRGEVWLRASRNVSMLLSACTSTTCSPTPCTDDESVKLALSISMRTVALT